MYAPSPERRDTPELPPLDQLSLRDPARPEDPGPDGTVRLAPERFSPVSLELKGLSPSELEAVLSAHDFPFDRTAVGTLVNVLYGRAQLDIDALRKETCAGVAIDLNYNRDYTVGAGKFSEERSFTMSIEPTGVGCPYIIFDMKRSEPNKTGETVDLKLSWDLEMMMGLSLEDTRWAPFSETLARLDVPGDPEKYELQRKDGRIDPKVAISERVSMEISPFEVRDLTEEEIEMALGQRRAPHRHVSLAWTPCAVHVEEPTPAQQEKLLSTLGLSGYSKMLDVGLIEEGMNVAMAGEVNDKDVFWQLYDLPSEISIRQKTFFGVGDPTFGIEEIQGQDPDDDEEAGYDPDEAGDMEEDHFDSGLDPEAAYGHPELHQMSITKLPVTPQGMEVTIHGPFPIEFPGTSEVDGRAPYVSFDWNPSELSRESSKELWNKIKAINSALGGMDVLDAMVKRLPNDPFASAVTFHLDKIAVTFVLVEREERPVQSKS